MTRGPVTWQRTPGKAADLEGWPNGKAPVPKTGDGGHTPREFDPLTFRHGWLAERQGSRLLAG